MSADVIHGAENGHTMIIMLITRSLRLTQPKNIYSLYYVDSNGKEHKVLKSHNFVKIDNSGPNKIAKETTSRTNLPLHIQRRMLDFLFTVCSPRRI